MKNSKVMIVQPRKIRGKDEIEAMTDSWSPLASIFITGVFYFKFIKKQ
jgi:hypothetical protein